MKCCGWSLPQLWKLAWKISWNFRGRRKRRHGWIWKNVRVGFLQERDVVLHASVGVLGVLEPILKLRQFYAAMFFHLKLSPENIDFENFKKQRIDDGYLPRACQISVEIFRIFPGSAAFRFRILRSAFVSPERKGDWLRVWFSVCMQ